MSEEFNDPNYKSDEYDEVDSYSARENSLNDIQSITQTSNVPVGNTNNSQDKGLCCNII